MQLINITVSDQAATGFQEHDVKAIRALARRLPGRWKAEAEQTDDGAVYIGLVKPSFDHRAFPILLSASGNDEITAHWWTGEEIGKGAPEQVFRLITAALTDVIQHPNHTPEVPLEPLAPEPLHGGQQAWSSTNGVVSLLGISAATSGQQSNAFGEA